MNEEMREYQSLRNWLKQQKPAAVGRTRHYRKGAQQSSRTSAIFCKNCRYFRTVKTDFFGVFYECLANRFIEQVNTFRTVRHVVITEKPWEKNKNNDCPDFAPATWLRRIIRAFVEL